MQWVAPDVRAPTPSVAVSFLGGNFPLSRHPGLRAASSYCWRLAAAGIATGDPINPVFPRKTDLAAPILTETGVHSVCKAARGSLEMSEIRFAGKRQCREAGGGHAQGQGRRTIGTAHSRN